MTDILSSNIVRGALAVLVLGAVVYGFNTTSGDVATTTTASTENVSTVVGNGTITPVVDTTTEATTTEVTTTEETNETTAE